MKKIILIALIAIISFTSCTEQTRAKHWGGTATVDLPAGDRLVNITWKETELWILTKQDTTPPTTYTFQENSSFGIIEGKIVINEK